MAAPGTRGTVTEARPDAGLLFLHAEENLGQLRLRARNDHVLQRTDTFDASQAFPSLKISRAREPLRFIRGGVAQRDIPVARFGMHIDASEARRVGDRFRQLDFHDMGRAGV